MRKVKGGVKVSDEDFSEVEEADDDYLTAIRIGDTVAEIQTMHRQYNLDLRHVDKSEIKEAKNILDKMNYDQRFKFSIA